MITYRAVKNEIRDQDGRQIAVVLPSNCTKQDAHLMAVFAAEQMNLQARNKARTALAALDGKGRP